MRLDSQKTFEFLESSSSSSPSEKSDPPPPLGPRPSRSITTDEVKPFSGSPDPEPSPTTVTPPPLPKQSTGPFEGPDPNATGFRPCLYILDGYSLIFQVFHALPEMTGPAGQPTQATFGI